jgi:hypothetical protein
MPSLRGVVEATDVMLILDAVSMQSLMDADIEPTSASLKAFS